MKKRLIEFVTDAPAGGFTKGQRVELNEASAWHWVRRDKAKYIEQPERETAAVDPAASKAVTPKPTKRKPTYAESE